jgi:hypothetical protein
MQLCHCEERSDEAISQPIDKENDSDEAKGNRCKVKPDCLNPALPGVLTGTGQSGFSLR